MKWQVGCVGCEKRRLLRRFLMRGCGKLVGSKSDRQRFLFDKLLTSTVPVDSTLILSKGLPKTCRSRRGALA